MIHSEDNIIVINAANAHASPSFMGVGSPEQKWQNQKIRKVIECYLS